MDEEKEVMMVAVNEQFAENAKTSQREISSAGNTSSQR